MFTKHTWLIAFHYFLISVVSELDRYKDVIALMCTYSLFLHILLPFLIGFAIRHQNKFQILLGNGLFILGSVSGNVMEMVAENNEKVRSFQSFQSLRIRFRFL